MIAFLTRVRQKLSAILICISFMVKDVEHFFMYLLGITSSFENCLFSSFALLFTGLLILWRVKFFELPVYSDC
jgi:hypothetical protein